jgi:LCP family protein required for cell wall assembly
VNEGSAVQPPEDRPTAARPPRRRPWKWIVLGVVAFLVVAAIVAGVGSYWWFSDKVETANERTTGEVEEALSSEPSTTLVSVEQAPEALNIILLGSEATGTTGEASGRSSTIMVLHLDPKLDFASLLSIPRDLYVDIPGKGKDRISAAYTLGGTQLTIATVKEVLGLDIDRYVEVDFDAFAKIVDSIGGVYVDVDRRYEGTTSQPLDLNPGYQLLSGADALSFARYRFDANQDLGRMTRQQRVLAAVREQAVGWDLPLQLPGFVSAILDATATNLSTNEIIKLAYWLVKLDGDRMSQTVVTAPKQKIEDKWVMVADQETLEKAVTRLLTSPTDGPADGATTSIGNGSTTTSSATAGPTSTTPGSTSAGTGNGGPSDLPDSDVWVTAQKGVPFTLEAPRFIPAGFSYAGKMPAEDGPYQIQPGDTSKPAVRMLYRQGTADLYLGITATTWTDAPVAGSGREVESNGVTYTIVGTSGKVSHIWWKKDGVLYFVSNTLTYDVSKEDLLKMAVSMAPVAGT